ncbi:MAG: hypothetical protein KC553_04455 [Nitrospina sp.]|nr:hypothetical protein [Nitrospina sp.]
MPVMRMKKESASPAQRIKDEARRRIVAAVGPEWKQFNLMARAVELLMRESRGVITPPQAMEFQRIMDVWDWVKAVRAASAALEASRPADYRDNRHWPPPPGA